jgi:hypothetical protein
MAICLFQGPILEKSSTVVKAAGAEAQNNDDRQGGRKITGAEY